MSLFEYPYASKCDKVEHEFYSLLVKLADYLGMPLTFFQSSMLHSLWKILLLENAVVFNICFLVWNSRCGVLLYCSKLSSKFFKIKSYNGFLNDNRNFTFLNSQKRQYWQIGHVGKAVHCAICINHRYMNLSY